MEVGGAAEGRGRMRGRGRRMRGRGRRMRGRGRRMRERGADTDK